MGSQLFKHHSPPRLVFLSGPTRPFKRRGSRAPTNAARDRSAIKDIVIPALVEELVIILVPSDLHEGLSVAHLEYSGRERWDGAKSWTAHVTVHDPENGALFARVKGLHHVKLGAHAQIDPHVFFHDFLETRSQPIDAPA